MNLQALVNKFKIIAGVYAFDILPDGSNSEIRIMAINALNDMMFNVLPDAPEFYPGVPLRRYFTEINLENFMYTCAVNNEPLYSYVNAFGMWIKGFYLPLDEEGNIINEKGEPNTSPRTAYCLYLTTRSEHPETEYMSQHSEGVSSAVVDISLKLHETADFYQAMAATVGEIKKICGANNCAIYTVDVSNQHCDFINSDGLQNDYPKNFAIEMGRSPYEVAMAWEKSLEDSDCLLLDDLSVIQERDPVWYNSLCMHDINNIMLYAIRNNNMLVGFIWAANYDISRRMQIKETLELTTFLISSVIANHQFVSQLEFKSSVAFGDYDIYRAGGDEFFVFCPDITEDELKQQVNQLYSLANSTPDVSFAVGFIHVTGEYDIRNTMKTADELMYKDKKEYYRLHPEKDRRNPYNKE